MSADQQLEKQVRKEFPGLLNNLPGDKKKQILDFLRTQPRQVEQAAASIIHQSIKATTSPVPPAELLEGYNRAIPNGADMLFVLVEN